MRLALCSHTLSTLSQISLSEAPVTWPVHQLTCPLPPSVTCAGQVLLTRPPVLEELVRPAEATCLVPGQQTSPGPCSAPAGLRGAASLLPASPAAPAPAHWRPRRPFSRRRRRRRGPRSPSAGPGRSRRGGGGGGICGDGDGPRGARCRVIRGRAGGSGRARPGRPGSRDPAK